MKIKQAIKYNISNSWKAVTIFYGVQVLCYLLLAFIFYLVETNTGAASGSMNGNWEFSAVVFIMVMGIVFSAENFKMMLQNGVSRKTTFIGFTIYYSLLALAIAVANQIFTALLPFISNSLLISIYEGHYANLSYGMQGLEMIVIFFSLYTFFVFFGLFLNLFFGKLNRAMKAIVPVTLSLLFIVVLPLIDMYLTNGAILRALGNFILLISGMKNGGNPMILAGFLLLGAVILGVVNWLMIRRMPIKE